MSKSVYAPFISDDISRLYKEREEIDRRIKYREFLATTLHSMKKVGFAGWQIFANPDMRQVSTDQGEIIHLMPPPTELGWVEVGLVHAILARSLDRTCSPRIKDGETHYVFILEDRPVTVIVPNRS